MRNLVDLYDSANDGGDRVITIREAKEIGLIPVEYHSSIKDTCDVTTGGCGSELLTTENLSTQRCSNHRCRLKLAGRAIKLLNNFGIDGISKNYCRKFFMVTGYDSHLAILVATEEQYYSTGRIADSIALMNSIKRVLSETYTFDEIVSKLGLPEMGTKALTIFNKFISYQMLQRYLEIKGISLFEYLANLPGLGYRSGKLIEETMNDFKLELELVPSIFKIKPNGRLVYEIAITGKPDFHLMSKQEFMKYLNRIGRNIVECKYTSSALESCDYIVSANANDYKFDEHGYTLTDSDGEPIIRSGSIKQNTGIRRNKKEKRKVLITPEEMKNIVLDGVRKYGQ